MRLNSGLHWLIPTAAALLVAAAAHRETAPRPSHRAAPVEATVQPAPRPLPQHEVLKEMVGVWDATIRMESGPGQPPRLSRAIETDTMECGGLWLITDIRGEMMGSPFQGRGTYGYDPARGRYIGVWVDSTSTFFWLSEGDYDPRTRTLTMRMEGPGADGRMVGWRTTNRWKDSRTRIFTMYQPDAEGGEVPAMVITYTRRK